jgi:hypothetical protein
LKSNARLLIVTLWVGSLWTIGYLVAPVLFSSLADRVLAGTIAGSLFRVEAWLSLGCGAVLLLLGSAESDPRRKKLWLAMIVAMMACTAIGYFGLQPMMAALRAEAPNGLLTGAARTQFGILHGVAAGFYLLQSLLGAWLIVRVGRAQ